MNVPYKKESGMFTAEIIYQRNCQYLHVFFDLCEIFFFHPGRFTIYYYHSLA